MSAGHGCRLGKLWIEEKEEFEKEPTLGDAVRMVTLI